MIEKLGSRTPILFFLAISLWGCGEAGGGLGETNMELAHVLGDAMGSVDETLSRSMLTVVPMAGGGCYQATYSSCTDDERNVTYDACSLGSLTLSGEVSFVFTNGSGCSLSVNGESVRRVPDFEIQGRSGGKVGVVTFNPTSSGQTITRVASGSYTYSVSGLRRYFENSNGERVTDLTVRTTEDIEVTGTTRATRQMLGGTLEVLNNLDDSKLLISPDALQWTSTCTCATSGSWVGQVVDSEGGTSDFVVKILGCGSAQITTPETTSTLTLERCSTL